MQAFFFFLHSLELHLSHLSHLFLYAALRPQKYTLIKA